MPKRTTKIKVDESQSSLDINIRQRQSKKDEALRKKLEQDFSKKQNNSSKILLKRTPGTVSALKPNQAVTVKENMLVIESAQFMSAKRCDCVLVVDENDRLSGIFTAKDIAYRLVAEGLDAGTTTVSQIMTKNPLCVTSDTSATEALDVMVSRGFRHLPVVSNSGDIFGLLDITKCLYQALEKMERAFGSSQKLHEALEGVERNWANDNSEMTDYLSTLRENMACPTLGSVLDNTLPAEVKHRANVREIAILMKELHTTAVLVTRSSKLQGIFTSKDIVLRVIAAGLNPDNTTVARVMTPKPYTATPETTVLDALKLMNDGHYLNLPVIGHDTIVGMVDVLKLTYVTLEQMNSIQGSNEEGGAMMSGFWGNFDTDPNENKSQLSENPQHYLTPPPFISPQTSTSTRSYSDVLPSESVSMTYETNSTLTTHLSEGTFAFKFTWSGDRMHRVVSRPIYNELLEAVRLKLPLMESDALSLLYLDDEDDKVLMTCDHDVKDAVNLAVQRKQSNIKLFVQDNRKMEPARVAQNKDETMRDKSTKSIEVPSTIITKDAPSTKVTQDMSSTKATKEVPPTKPTKEEPPTKFTKDVTKDVTKDITKDVTKGASSTDKTPLKAQTETQSNDLLLPALIGIIGVVIMGAFAYSKIQLKSK